MLMLLGPGESLNGVVGLLADFLYSFKCVNVFAMTSNQILCLTLGNKASVRLFITESRLVRKK